MADGIPSALAGKRIVITRAAEQCEALSKELSERGAIPVLLPLISCAEPVDFEPLVAAIRGMGKFDWRMFPRAHAVRAVAARCETLGLSLRQQRTKPEVAAVGPVSGEAASAAGFSVAYVAETHNGVALAKELGERLRDRNVLLPRSDRANPDLPEALRQHGAVVTEVIAYRTLQASEFDQRVLQEVAGGNADAVLFFSPSAVQHFAELIGPGKLGTLENKMAFAAVGTVTAGALRKIGARRSLTSADTSAASVLEALETHFAEDLKRSHAGAKQG